MCSRSRTTSCARTTRDGRATIVPSRRAGTTLPRRDRKRGRACSRPVRPADPRPRAHLRRPRRAPRCACRRRRDGCHSSPAATSIVASTSQRPKTLIPAERHEEAVVEHLRSGAPVSLTRVDAGVTPQRGRREAPPVPNWPQFGDGSVTGAGGGRFRPHNRKHATSKGDGCVGVPGNRGDAGGRRGDRDHRSRRRVGRGGRLERRLTNRRVPRAARAARGASEAGGVDWAPSAYSFESSDRGVEELGAALLRG
jgi:hypothetical protein